MSFIYIRLKCLIVCLYGGLFGAFFVSKLLFTKVSSGTIRVLAWGSRGLGWKRKKTRPKKQNRKKKKKSPTQPNTNKTPQRNTQTSCYLFVCHCSAFPNMIGFLEKKFNCLNSRIISLELKVPRVAFSYGIRESSHFISHLNLVICAILKWSVNNAGPLDSSSWSIRQNRLCKWNGKAKRWRTVAPIVLGISKRSPAAAGVAVSDPWLLL